MGLIRRYAELLIPNSSIFVSLDQRAKKLKVLESFRCFFPNSQPAVMRLNVMTDDPSVQFSHLQKGTQELLHTEP